MWRVAVPAYRSVGGPIARVAAGVQIADWRATTRDPALVDAVVAGVELLARVDPRRALRLRLDMPRVVLLDAMPGPATAGFAPGARACCLNSRFLTDAPTGTRPALVALLLAHEATHARLDRLRPLPWRRGVRDRVERVCLRAELAFAARLPVPPYGQFRRWVAEQVAGAPAATPTLVGHARALAAAA